MNVYVESNFVLEMVFQQEQSEACERILAFCESTTVELLIPAYCLAEPHEKLRRQNNSRQELQRNLNAELRQLARTSSYAARVQSIKDIADLLIQSSEDERQRFTHIQRRILQVAVVIPLTTEILLVASGYEHEFDLIPQDAIVFASVMGYLKSQNNVGNCFLNRNSRDFDNPDIVHALNQFHCKMIPKFDDGLRFIQSTLNRS